MITTKCAADSEITKNTNAHSDSSNVRLPSVLKTYPCKYQIRISQGIMYTTWGITRKLRQCLQFSCTWAPKPWNHWWKCAKTPRNLGSKLCNWGLLLVSLAFQTWTYNLFWPIIHYRLIIYSSETLKYGQLKLTQKKTLKSCSLVNNWVELKWISKQKYLMILLWANFTLVSWNLFHFSKLYTVHLFKTVSEPSAWTEILMSMVFLKKKNTVGKYTNCAPMLQKVMTDKYQNMKNGATKELALLFNNGIFITGPERKYCSRLLTILWEERRRKNSEI